MRSLRTFFLTVVFCLTATGILAQQTMMKLTVNNTSELTATLVDNSSTAALIELLKDKPLTIEMHDYGSMEKVGSIGTSLPRNDEQITTEPGDIILYQGSALVIYYAPNSWNFTRLGKINNITQQELKAVLGEGDVSVKLELADTATSIKHKDENEDLFQVYLDQEENYLNVSGRFDRISLLDINGKSIMTSQDNTVNINHVPSGIYFVKIETGQNGTVVKKIQKRS
ncbi:cyclophilin-like fold protein [Saccharicrinis sp. FJH62]|uniref:cyclophilin-like fold protein n=1 Tax=Saccharicrinis sp. FJH62 TaxID=3344657 RepID=UPI0035D441BD